MEKRQRKGDLGRREGKLQIECAFQKLGEWEGFRVSGRGSEVERQKPKGEGRERERFPPYSWAL